MLIKEISLVDFRLLKNNHFTFSPFLNVIHGPNATGKTTLLEAVSFLSDSRSFRTNLEKQVINYSSTIAYLEAKIVANDIVHRLRIEVSNLGKTILVDQNPSLRLSEFIGTFITIVFTPNDVSLLKDAPRHRRKFIDASLSAMSPIYLMLLLRYHRILREKSKHLRHYRVDDKYLEVLNQRLAELSLEIYNRRKKLILGLEKSLNKYYNILAQDKELTIKYQSFVEEEASLVDVVNKLNNLIEKEKEKRAIVGGIHLDDYVIKDKLIEVGSYYSQGQSRMIVLSLKLGLRDLFKQEIGEYPVLLLDDVLSELDSMRQTRLLTILGSEGQVLITTNSIDIIEGVSEVKDIHLIELKGENDGKQSI